MYPGYFALVYQWDYRCHSLIESIRKRFQRISRELLKLEQEKASNRESLLTYYRKWHYSKELFQFTINQIEKRQFVINSLGYRGYGVNRNLYDALSSIKHEYGLYLGSLLDEKFKKNLTFAKKVIHLPKKVIDSRNSAHIIEGLCKKLGRNPDRNILKVSRPAVLNLHHYFTLMKETPWQTNTAIFQKLFLNVGSSSMTITKGCMGYHNLLSPWDLKLIGNRNLLAVCCELFSNLHVFSEIGLDLLKRIHYVLSKDIDPDAGNFRTFDFPDKNGVTFDFDNFQREIGDLSHVLWETGQSFHNLDSFIYDLSRSYYMLLGIHPFRDSNGRASRCFINYMLIKKGIPPISFNFEDEALALPRYGGGMEEMHDYLKIRIRKAVDSYFYERKKLEDFGLFNKHICNVSFDTGFHFRQEGKQLEVNFQAYLIPDSNPLSWEFQDQCKIVFPNENHLYSMAIYCGFSCRRHGEWEQVFCLKKNLPVEEIKSDLPGIRVFDIDFILVLQDGHYDYNYFNCCVVSSEGGRIFNNKRLNYSYRIERTL